MVTSAYIYVRILTFVSHFAGEKYKELKNLWGNQDEGKFHHYGNVHIKLNKIDLLRFLNLFPLTCKHCL